MSPYAVARLSGWGAGRRADGAPRVHYRKNRSSVHTPGATRAVRRL